MTNTSSVHRIRVEFVKKPHKGVFLKWFKRFKTKETDNGGTENCDNENTSTYAVVKAFVHAEDICHFEAHYLLNF
jgi:hypothetical protein